MFHGLFSTSFVTMPSSKPTCVGRVNNLYQEPFFEDYDCPLVEDYYRKKEEQCDFEVESEDDGWRGTENHRCPVGFLVSLLRWSTTIEIYG